MRFCVGFRWGRRPEEGDDGVPFVFVERSLVFVLDDVCHGRQVIVQQIDQLFRVADLFGNGGKSLDVRKEGCQVFFAAEFRFLFAQKHFVDELVRYILLERLVEKRLVAVFEIESRKKGSEKRQDGFDEVGRAADVETVCEERV